MPAHQHHTNYREHYIKKNHISRKYSITHSHRQNSPIFPLQPPHSRKDGSRDFSLLLNASLPDELAGKKAILL